MFNARSDPGAPRKAWGARSLGRSAFLTDRAIARLGAIFVALFVLLAVRQVWLQVVAGPKLSANQYNPRHAQIFFSLYFVMTGLHALHMIIGLGIFTWLLTMAWKGRFSPEYHTPVEIGGLYWHFVDIVWIYLFPLLYLIDRHP